ncbi:MAG: hypothetical protein SGJ01_14600 [Gemmatimonadota bacterium]|nr:hypothetical protein [Gemmatimonadota bacterium]
MDVTFAHLCDYATVSQDGKLSVMGIFGAINTPQVPAVHPQMYLAFELAFDYTEIGRDFTAGVQIVDEDGKIIWDLKGGGSIQSPLPPKPGDTPTAGQIFVIQGLKFDKFGSYDVNIFANGRPAKRIALKLNRMAAPSVPNS